MSFCINILSKKTPFWRGEEGPRLCKGKGKARLVELVLEILLSNK